MKNFSNVFKSTLFYLACGVHLNTIRFRIMFRLANLEAAFREKCNSLIWRRGGVVVSRLGWSLHCCVVSLHKKLCCALSLFTQVYKWVPAAYCRG